MAMGRSKRKQRNLTCLPKLQLPMFVRITSLSMILAITASVVAGVPLHPSDRGCAMPVPEMKDCGQIAHWPTSPGVTSFHLCCLIDCQEPGPTSTTVTVRVPSFSGAFLDEILHQSPLVLSKLAPPTKWVHTSSFTPPDTYLKNLALLI